MQHFNVFDDKIVHRFDFKGYYIGYVLDNSEFEETLQIKVFIPELFGYNYTPNIKNIDKKLELSTSHIFNRDFINIKTQIDKQEYIYSRILIDRNSLIGSKENFIKINKPDIGDKVLVSFFNNNPNNCIYENKIFLADSESLQVIEDTKTSTKTIKIVNTGKTNKSETDKITWQYIDNI